ncbi:hypothetical protein [Wenxinia marina]|uniref:DUF3329 domain-containing protein n=1 Tax=Wenxinia marina DSM 24838 TaxID=1123501 RepID=A0A0D0QBZ9_9RHOB|nr:hypothetical protein [Wenxinia marina]KIQ69812.1 hypothetical protein Wenmar_01382 [Wenxinia marina DSM 24838]GGL61441.1 hypothetical protein GCM10011392_14840 [Wenxinia marina]
MKLLDRDHPFFRPLWRRVAVTAVCFGWAGVEASSGEAGWATIFVGLGIWCVWELFLARPGTPPGDRDG